MDSYFESENYQDTVLKGGVERVAPIGPDAALDRQVGPTEVAAIGENLEEKVLVEGLEVLHAL